MSVPSKADFLPSSPVAPPLTKSPKTAEHMADVFETLREEAEFTASLRSKSSRQGKLDSEGIFKRDDQPRPSRSVARRAPRRRFGIEFLFLVSLVLAVMGAVYGKHDDLAKAFPKFDPQLSAYASMIDDIKAALIKP